MMLRTTYLGANGWWLAFGDLTVLVDPWLTGDLVFPPGPWLLRGRLLEPCPLPGPPDLLLLTQGLPDHCHPPSLQLLDRRLPVVGSTSAVTQVRRLGFTAVTALRPGEVHRHRDLEITATAGAAVPVVENGYLLDHPCGHLYLEPHGFLAEDLPARRLDAVITPVVDLGLPLAGAFVKGRQVLPRLLERFDPLTVLASTAGGEVQFDGLLSRVFRQEGSVQEAAATVAACRSGECRLLDPVPGTAYTPATR
ncbi:MBL fold metallo-hydrolase [Synechococcus sp. CCY 9618]|uniref:MBL fold metallo-hydrolase n=1 Tax=Synechococcus sp. CCY 9618 TaxID=2815602 RepID=UPI001C237954|nr:MBL fold metallo-hydrolase [Synechococcus sp. CCY 9618]